MRTSAAGNKPPSPSSRPQGPGGFTLLELMLVLFIVALVGSGIAWAVGQQGRQGPLREAQRLSALLESARAVSRASGRPVLWRTVEGGFDFPGLEQAQIQAGRSSAGENDDGTTTRQTWLHEGARAEIITPSGAVVLILGPEPVLPVQRVRLHVDGVAIDVGSKGVQAFAPVFDEDSP